MSITVGILDLFIFGRIFDSIGGTSQYKGNDILTQTNSVSVPFISLTVLYILNGIRFEINQYVYFMYLSMFYIIYITFLKSDF